MGHRRDRCFALRTTGLILALSAGGCSLLIGSELNGKPAETTGAGGGGGVPGVTTGAGGTGTGSGGKPADAGGSVGPGGPVSSSSGSGPTCPNDTADCDGNPMHVCDTDLKDDPRNCGACGVVCQPPGSCQGGKCK
jgi:hypothetical protein